MYPTMLPYVRGSCGESHDRHLTPAVWISEVRSYQVQSPNQPRIRSWLWVCIDDLPTSMIRSGCFDAGFGEGEPLVAEVGDDLQAAAEGFDVGGQGAQFGGARLGVLNGGHAALSDAHPDSDLGLGHAEAAAHLGEPEGTLLGAQLFHSGGDGGLVGRIGMELVEE